MIFIKRTLSFLIFLFLVLICGCYDFSEDDRYLKYYQTKQLLLENQSFINDPLNYQVEVTASENNSHKYDVFIVIDSVQQPLSEIELLVVDSRQKANPTDQIFPSLNLVITENITLVPTDPNPAINQLLGVVLYFESPQRIESLLIYFSYYINDQQVIDFLEIFYDNNL